MVSNIAKKITVGCHTYTVSQDWMADDLEFNLGFSQATVDPLNPTTAPTTGPTITIVASQFVEELLEVTNLSVESADATEAAVTDAGPATVVNVITSEFGTAFTLTAANIAGDWRITFTARVKMFDGKEVTKTYTEVIAASTLWPGLSL